MASGEKLTNTNLNLIQDSDKIDSADINAIAQAVESARVIMNRFVSAFSVAPEGNVGALATGIYWVDPSKEYSNLPDGHTRGVLMIFGLTSSISLQIFVNQANLYYRTWISSDTRWYGWYKLTGDPAPLGTLPNGTDLYTLGTGTYSLGNSGEYVNGIDGMHGVLRVTEAGPKKLMTYHHQTGQIYTKARGETSWTSWREI